ncbi:MAG: hypothetical protein NC489_28270 [Ruminococcus flavefaciens]|nr:hypothetical protein [Ruminococcus flavefaciens]
METSVNKKVVIVGVGNCGSQVANLAEKKYPDLFDSVYINTSEADLSMVAGNEELKFKIGDKKYIEGSGKNRAKMKEFLKKDVEKIFSSEVLQTTIASKKYCFIVTSAAGGTGSGATPILMEIMRQMFPDTNFILVGVLPQIGASLMEQGNTLEFLTELYDVLGDQTTYMVYDNESTAELPPTKALDVVNDNIVEDIRILTGIDNYPTPYESIDEADMESIISTPGRLLVVRINKNLTEKSMEDNSLSDMIVKAIKQSCHTETDRNKKVTRWGIITYFTDRVNDLYDPELAGLQDFIGVPIERFNHNSINDTGKESLNFMYLVASGLSPINDRVKRVTDRVEELKQALASDDSSKYVLSGDSTSYEALSARRLAEKRAKMPEQINTDDIFKKFMNPGSGD